MTIGQIYSFSADFHVDVYGTIRLSGRGGSNLNMGVQIVSIIIKIKIFMFFLPGMQKTIASTTPDYILLKLKKYLLKTR